MKASPRPILFDVALKERLLPPKNEAMSQLSESKGGKLKKSICRQKHNSVQKRASFWKPCNPLWPYQPGQKAVRAPLCSGRDAGEGPLWGSAAWGDVCVS